MKTRIRFLLIAVFSLVILDQVTKWLIATHLVPGQSVPVIGEWVRFTFIYNMNGAFGLSPAALLPVLNNKLFFTTFTLAAGTLVVWLYFRAEPRERWTRIGLTLIIAGALGNLIDRVRLGHVLDFIDCDFPDFIMERFAIFNVADSCITVGIALLVILTLRGKKHETPPPVDCCGK